MAVQCAGHRAGWHCQVCDRQGQDSQVKPVAQEMLLEMGEPLELRMEGKDVWMPAGCEGIQRVVTAGSWTQGKVSPSMGDSGAPCQPWKTPRRSRLTRGELMLPPDSHSVRELWNSLGWEGP